MTQQQDSPTTLCFEAEVVRLQRLSPTFLRITFGGESIALFDDGGELGPRDMRIKLVLPAGGEPGVVDTSGDGWYQRWLRLDPVVRGEMRTYTARSVRHEPHGSEVDVDVVLHEAHDGADGPAIRWARDARIGDRMLLLGPNRSCGELYGGIDWAPPQPRDEAVRVLLVADETAVPAVAAILETLPYGYVGRAVLEVPDAADFLQLRTEADVEVTWLARGARERGALLTEAVQAALPPVGQEQAVPDVDPDLLWETPTGLGLRPDGSAPYVWIAGEAGVVKGLRRYLVGQAGLPRDTVAFMGYWRVGATG